MHKMTQPKVYEFKGKLYIQFTLDGKRVRKSLNMDDTKVNRYIVKNEIIPKLILRVNSGEYFNESKVLTVDECQNMSFEKRRHTRSQITNHDYLNIYKKHIAPYFGNKKIDMIEETDIESWQNQLRDLGLGKTRINDIKKILSTIFKDAIRKKYIKSNPVSGADGFDNEIENVNLVNPFTLDEVNRIINCASGQTKNFIAISFATGLRTGEMIGLKWEDIDFENKHINVIRTIGRGIERKPKTSKSRRPIFLTDFALMYLKCQFQYTGEQNSYIFLNEQNTHYYDAKNTLRQWKQVLKDAGIEYRTQYQTRHTYCSLLLKNGKDISYVSTMMGHTNSRITYERYFKFIASKDDYESVFDKLL
jgi:integrase